MGIITSLKKIFNQRSTTPANVKPQITQTHGNYFYPPTKSGTFVNEKSALTNATVYACAKVLCESISVLPAALYNRAEKGKTTADDHPVNWVLAHEPNPESTPSTYKKTTTLHRVLWGNSFSWIRRDTAGRVRELYTLLPENTIVYRDAAKNIKYTTTVDGRVIELDSSEVLHIPGLSLDGIVGRSVIGLHRETIGLSVSAQEYGARFFGQGANPKGVISVTENLTHEQADTYRDHFGSLYSGLDNSHNVAVISGGAKFDKITIPNNDAQFLETRNFQKKEICGIMGVPPIMIQDSDKASAWGSGIELIMTAFVRNTLLPYLVSAEEAINQKLLSAEDRKKYYCKFNIDGLMRGDFKSRMEGYNIGRLTGIYSINEIRGLEDLTPIDNGDDHLQPLNYTAVGIDGTNAASATKTSEVIQ